MDNRTRDFVVPNQLRDIEESVIDQLPEISFDTSDEDDEDGHIPIFSRASCVQELDSEFEEVINIPIISQDAIDQSEFKIQREAFVDEKTAERDVTECLFSGDSSSGLMNLMMRAAGSLRTISTTTTSTSTGMSTDPAYTTDKPPHMSSIREQEEVEREQEYTTNKPQMTTHEPVKLSFRSNSGVDLESFLEYVNLPSDDYQENLLLDAANSVERTPPTNESVSLIEQLAASAQKYIPSRSTRKQLSDIDPYTGASRRPPSSAPPTAAASRVYRQVPPIAVQLHEEVTVPDTVKVDLRDSQPQNLSIGSAAAVRIAREVEFRRARGAGDDEDGLWLDRYREQRNGVDREMVRECELPEKPKYTRKKKPEIIDDSSASTATVEVSCDSSTFTETEQVNCDSSTFAEQVKPSAPPVSDYVKQKIAEIKRKEQERSERRALGESLSSHCTLDSNWTPILFHEDTSFAIPARPLPDDILEHSDNLVLLSARLGRPGELLESSSGRLRPLEPTCLAALLSWLLHITNPFKVVALQQQIVNKKRLHLMVLVRSDNPSSVRRFLKQSNLRDCCGGFTNDKIPAVSLSSVLNVITSSYREYFIEESSVYWCIMSCDVSAHWQACSLEMETTWVQFDADLLMSSPEILYQLVKRCVEAGLDVVAVRMLYGQYGGHDLPVERRVVLLVRGAAAVEQVRGICGPGTRSSLMSAPCSAGWWGCARFPESVLREMAAAFGPRFSMSSTHSQLSNQLPQLVVAPPLSDILLVVSSLLPDIGWILHAVAVRGFALVGLRKLRLNSDYLVQDLNMTAAQSRVFSQSGDVTHVLLLRQENSALHAPALVKHLCDLLQEQTDGSEEINPSSWFYTVAHHPDLLKTLGANRWDILPSMYSQINLEPALPEPPFLDCEHSSVVVVAGLDYQNVAAQLLDECSHHELLAVKTLPTLPLAHCQLLVKHCRGSKVTTSHLQSSPCVLFLFRGCYLLKELRAMTSRGQQSDTCLVYSLTQQSSLVLVLSFFSRWELIYDPPRRLLAACLSPAVLSIAEESDAIDQLAAVPNPVWSEQTSVLLLRAASDWLRTLVRLWKRLEQENFRLEMVELRPEGLAVGVTRSQCVYHLCELVDEWNSTHPDKPLTCGRSWRDAQVLWRGLLGQSHTCPVMSQFPGTVNATHKVNPMLLTTQEVSSLVISEAMFMRSSSLLDVLNCLEHGCEAKLLGLRVVKLAPNVASLTSKLDLRSLSVDHNSDHKLSSGRCLIVLLEGPLLSCKLEEFLRTELSGILSLHGRHMWFIKNSTFVLNIASRFLRFVSASESLIEVK